MGLSQRFPELVPNYRHSGFNLDEAEKNFIARNGSEPKRNFKLSAQDHAAATAQKSRFEYVGDEKERKKLASILEVFFDKYAGSSKWFGPEAKVFAASEVDDYLNGIDFVLKLKDQNNKEVVIGIDLVVGDLSRIDPKIQNVKNAIKSGHLSELRYPNPQNNEQGKPIIDVPRVIVALSRDQIGKLLDLDLAVHNSEEQFKREFIKAQTEDEKSKVRSVYGAKALNSRKKIVSNTIQIEILEQILAELKTFSEYAQKIQQNNLAEKFNSGVSAIEKVLSIPEKHLMRAGDEYFESEKKSLKTIEKSLKTIENDINSFV